MKQLILSGTYYDIGCQLGRLYKANGKSLASVLINKKLLQKQLAIYEKHYPDFVLEVKGVAAGGAYDETKTIYQFLAANLSWTLEQDVAPCFTECSIFAVESKAGLLVGRNYDWDPVTEKIFKVYKVEPKNNYNYLAVSDMWISGARDLASKHHYYFPIDAINEHGLYVGLTAARNYNWSYGLSSVHMIKLIAEKCKTVAEAIEIIKKTPLNCAKNFLLADKSGQMAVIEHLSGLKFKVIHPRDGLLIKTNHFLHPDNIKVDKVKPTSNSFLRYYEIFREVNLRGAKFKQTDIIKILGRPGSHVLQDFPEIKTIWSLALNLRTGNYQIYYDLFAKRKSAKLKI